MKRSLTERILEKIDVRGFYLRYTELSAAAGNGECKGLCPLHEEKTPSFFVNLKTGSFKCFGCGGGGGPIQFYAAHYRISVFEAAKQLGREVDAGKESLDRTARRHPDPVKKKAKEGADNGSRQTRGSYTEVYAALLEAGQPLPEQVIAYFAQRKISAETLARFGIAYLAKPAAVAAMLQQRFSPELLTGSGVFRPGSEGRLRFQFQWHPLLFPVFRDRQPVFVQGRRFGDSSARSKYCNLNQVPVPALFNADSLREFRPGAPVCVCEGALDTMTLVQHGFAAVGVVGSSGFKSEWVDQLARFKVYLVLDNDATGRSGAKRISGLFHERDLPVSVVTLPVDAKDINDFFLSRSATDFEQLISSAPGPQDDLCSTVRVLLDKVADRSDSFSYPELAERIYSWFETHGGVFAVDPEQRCFLMFDQVLYEIGNNDPFNALMFSKTHLVNVQFQGKMVWQILRSLCFLRGRRQGNLSWIYTDESRGEIYINLHNAANQIVRLRSGNVDLLCNGSNDASVLLRRADKMQPVEFDPTVNPREAVRLLQSLVMEPLACEPENRFFLASWILTAFLLDYTTDKALLKLSGHTGSGKTTAVRILSCLLYGADHVESATVAYYYADASRNPYLVCDNLETENMNRDITQFLLHVATGISKGKRKGGTDSDTVRESSNALVAITAIEPLTRSELINRTYDVEFMSIFKKPGFMQREHLAALVAARSRILSGLFNLFAWEVLPGLQDKRQEILARLQGRYPQHSKQRVDSFLTLMIVILDALLKMIDPAKGRTWEIVDFWIGYQGRLSEETERDTNAAVYLLDALAKEMVAREEDFRKEYYLDFHKRLDGGQAPSEISFVASARDLLMTLQILPRTRASSCRFAIPSSWACVWPMNRRY